MRRLPHYFLALVVLFAPVTAKAELARTIDSNRILLGQLVTDLDEEAGQIDLGPAPRAGSSRLLGIDELNRALRSAGVPNTVTQSVRVVRSTKRWTQKALAEWVTPAIDEALPVYAKLVHLDVPRALTTATTIQIGTVTLGLLPKRVGSVRTSAIVELTTDGQLEQRVSLPLTVELTEPPKPVQVARGHSVMITIDLGHAQVAAPAVTLQSGEVGNVVFCRVLRTRKVLRVKLTSADAGKLVTE